MEEIEVLASELTLRDYFAAKAIKAVFSFDMTADDIAEFVYAIADSMLNARERPRAYRPDLRTFDSP